MQCFLLCSCRLGGAVVGIQDWHTGLAITTFCGSWFPIYFTLTSSFKCLWLWWTKSSVKEFFVFTVSFLFEHISFGNGQMLEMLFITIFMPVLAFLHLKWKGKKCMICFCFYRTTFVRWSRKKQNPRTKYRS